MDTTGWDKLEILVEQLLALPPEDRQAFLEQACGTDPALRAEVEALLALHEEAPRFFESLAGSVFPGRFPASPSPEASQAGCSDDEMHGRTSVGGCRR